MIECKQESDVSQADLMRKEVRKEDAEKKNKV